MGFPRVARALLVVVATAGLAAAEPREVTPKSSDVARTPGTTAVRDLPGSMPHLGLVVYDVHELLRTNYQEFVVETSAIFEEMGVATGWRRGGLGTVHGNGPLREIPVILLERAPGRLKAKQELLGLIPRNQPPAIWVFVEHVKTSIGPAAASDGLLLATAIARVVAHEMVHSLAPELGHTKTGLMRHTLDRQALVGQPRPSHLECAKAVRAALKLEAPASRALPAATAVALPFLPRY